MLLIIILTSVVISTFVVEVGFVYVMTCKRLKAKGLLRRDFALNAYVLFVPSLLGDFWLNMTRGSWMFRELPHELLFSSRVQRHVNESSGRDLATALEWAAILNEIDPDHIKARELE